MTNIFKRTKDLEARLAKGGGRDPDQDVIPPETIAFLEKLAAYRRGSLSEEEKAAFAPEAEAFFEERQRGDA